MICYTLLKTYKTNNMLVSFDYLSNIIHQCDDT